MGRVFLWHLAHTHTFSVSSQMFYFNSIERRDSGTQHTCIARALQAFFARSIVFRDVGCTTVTLFFCCPPHFSLSSPFARLSVVCAAWHQILRQCRHRSGVHLSSKSGVDGHVCLWDCLILGVTGASFSGSDKSSHSNLLSKGSARSDKKVSWHPSPVSSLSVVFFH